MIAGSDKSPQLVSSGAWEGSFLMPGKAHQFAWEGYFFAWEGSPLFAWEGSRLFAWEGSRLVAWEGYFFVSCLGRIIFTLLSLCRVRLLISG